MSEAHRTYVDRHVIRGAVQVRSVTPPRCPDEDERGVARNPLSGTDLVNDLTAKSSREQTWGGTSRHHGRSPGDAGGVAPIPLSEGHEPHDSELCVSRDTDSSLRTDGAVARVSATVMSPTPTSSGRSRSRRERRMRRRASVTSRTSDEVSNVTSSEAPRDCSEQLYTLVNGVTGVSMATSAWTPPHYESLVELDEMSIAEFGEALEGGRLSRSGRDTT
ncbi:hypothetical protein Pcac1_g24013 [Phytophthora cactorum]|nr:hypothetical protein Pcac1_g24013 [Phytophthora cactorum]